MRVHLSWNCDFCGKPCLVVSATGVVYCENCRMSYGESIFDTPVFDELDKLVFDERNRMRKGMLVGGERG